METKLKEIILQVLKSHTREMEGYSYYGSNPGVPEDEYEDVADEIVEKARGE